MIDHSRKLIFLEVPKNASSSVKAALGQPDLRGHRGWRQHCQAPELKNGYKTFGIVRNPWDRLVSCYEMARMPDSMWFEDGSHPDHFVLMDLTFADCVKLLVKSHHMLVQEGWIPQSYWLTDETGAVRCDHVFRFEDLEPLERFLGCVLERSNQATRSLVRWQDYYDEATREIVNTLYRQDIENWGYEFDG